MKEVEVEGTAHIPVGGAAPPTHSAATHRTNASVAQTHRAVVHHEPMKAEQLHSMELAMIGGMAAIVLLVILWGAACWWMMRTPDGRGRHRRVPRRDSHDDEAGWRFRRNSRDKEMQPAASRPRRPSSPVGSEVSSVVGLIGHGGERSPTDYDTRVGSAFA